MEYIAEFAGSLVFLLGGYAYMCNVSLKKTLVSTLNYVELVIAWSLAVGLGLTTAVIMGGPAYLNPGVIFGNLILGNLSVVEGLKYLLMEFLAAGCAEIVCLIFFFDSFKASKGVSKRGIFSAYPVEKNMKLNFVQEILATFAFLFLVFTCLKATGGVTAPLQIGVVGFAAVAILALTLNSTGFSMNAMRSVFSSVWFAIIPFPNKEGEKVDWPYQLIVNLVGSSIGGILAVYATSLF
ncbi:MAG: aquaporin [Lachnospiraceae bacterium]|nr:aquaporin [Lachnospiraceae bacterium]